MQFLTEYVHSLTKYNFLTKVLKVQPLTPVFTPAPAVKIMINLGACFDIPTGAYEKGCHGEYILNGGLAAVSGVVGIGNNFKSTVTNFMAYTGLSRFVKYSRGSTYDTEINIHESHHRQYKITREIQEAFGINIIDDGRWTITDKTVYTGDEFYDKYKEFLKDKRKNAKSYEVKTPFKDRDGGPLKVILPTFTVMDSASEFVTSDIIEMQNNNSLGESGRNTLSMRQGIGKNQFLMEVPGLANGSYDFLMMTAHIGNVFNMDPRNPAPKKLQHLKADVKIKGVPEKFTFVTNNLFHCYNAAPLINQGTKGPEFPRSPDDDLAGDTDLNVVSVKVLRSKSGPSGMAIMVLVSQKEGVLPSLTEFYNIKENGRYGLEGNDRNYNLALIPEVKLSRTTVRGKIDSDARLRRALNITSEMCQMNDLWHHLRPGLLCTPKELYDDLIKIGYDWETLYNTRHYWVVEEEEEGRPPFLSTMDLLMMRIGEYVPYWFTKEQKAKLDMTKVVNIDGATPRVKIQNATAEA